MLKITGNKIINSGIDGIHIEGKIDDLIIDEKENPKANKNKILSILVLHLLDFSS